MLSTLGGYRRGTTMTACRDTALRNHRTAIGSLPSDFLGVRDPVVSLPVRWAPSRGPLAPALLLDQDVP